MEELGGEATNVEGLELGIINGEVVTSTSVV
jgi:hypothetical protein